MLVAASYVHEGRSTYIKPCTLQKELKVTSKSELLFFAYRLSFEMLVTSGCAVTQQYRVDPCLAFWKLAELSTVRMAQS